MKFYARLIKNRVTEVWNDGGLNITPHDVHVPSIASEFIPCPETVQPGATRVGEEWINPPPVEPALPPEEMPEPIQ
ncbi:hypothetical protein [Aeromonas schubertii]|uniref:Uncharacterized protein n=1 Tax=Aeromonas schubertii TaxID=652 RepID=A0A0S2SLK5_9GAMM|nr:hypothetical protein [Aeromonas schubertii]ALP42625.1 hypothetical protein WL1483_3206 [Aeromonas schubertii]